VQFHQYLQWLANRQLAHAAARCEALGMGVGLYVDLAVSVDRAGSDAWSLQHCFAVGRQHRRAAGRVQPRRPELGPAAAAPRPPARRRLPLLHQTLRASMRGAGALRIDHVMGLMRLFWIPPGRGAHDGAYVYYPLDEMLAIVAIESHRHRCMVVGEDLGTVEDAVREALAQGRRAVLPAAVLRAAARAADSSRPRPTRRLRWWPSARTTWPPSRAGGPGHDLRCGWRWACSPTPPCSTSNCWTARRSASS
jgi:4-alpha-glucanotransferase